MGQYNAQMFLKSMRKIVEETKNALKRREFKRADIPNLYPTKFPISSDSWANYVSFVNENKKLNDIKIGTLYDLCSYTDVSADYFLGLNETKVKEASSEQIQKDFGLSTDALRCLAQMANHPVVPLPAKYQDFSAVDYIDFLIVNFAQKFLSGILDYFYALDEFEAFEAENIDPRTNRIKKKNITTELENTLITEHQELEGTLFDRGRFVEEQVKRLLLQFRKELTKKEDAQ